MAEKMNLTPEQQEAISEIDLNLQIIACAGSGKTEVISRRIANILQKKPDVKPENVVAFTKEIGFDVLGLDYSPVRGPEGNIEYLMYIKKSADSNQSFDIPALVDLSHTI